MEDTQNFSSGLWRAPWVLDLTLQASNTNNQAIPCGAYNQSCFLHEYCENTPLLQKSSAILCLVTTLRRRILSCCLKGIANRWTSPLWNPTASQPPPALMKTANNKHLLNHGEKNNKRTRCVAKSFVFRLMCTVDFLWPGFLLLSFFLWEWDSLSPSATSVNISLYVQISVHAVLDGFWRKEGKHCLRSGVNQPLFKSMRGGFLFTVTPILDWSD